MLDKLLCDTSRDARKHQKNCFDGVMWLDGKCTLFAVRSPPVCFAAGLRSQATIVFGHKCIKALSFHVFECYKESSVAKGIPDKGQTPASEDPTDTNVSYFESTVLPHVFVLALEHIACFESDL